MFGNATTYTNQVAPVLDMESLTKTIEFLKAPSDDDLQSIKINIPMDEFLEKTKAQHSPSSYVSQLYGYPVYTDETIPKGEIHLIDRVGRIIKKFIV